MKATLLNGVRRYLQSPSLRMLARAIFERKALLLSTLSANAISALLEGVSFVFLGFAVVVLSGGGLPQSAMRFPGGAFLPQSSTALFLSLIGLAIGSQVLRSTFGFFGSVLNVNLGTYARVEFQVEMTRRLLCCPFGIVQTLRGGDLAEALLAPSNTIVELVDAFNRVLVYTMMIVVYGAMLLRLAPGLTALALGIFSVVIYLQRHLTTGVRRAAGEAADDSAMMTANVVEQTQALRTIHLFSLQEKLIAKSRRIFERMRASNRQLNSRYFGAQAINESAMLLAIGLFLGLAYVSFRGPAGFPFANFVIFVAILNRLAARCNALQTCYSDIVRRVGLMARADDFLNQVGTARARNSGIALSPLSQAITVEDVVMCYPGRTEPALNGVSLRIGRGQAIGLVGESGAGKSTLADLLLGLHDPSAGAICSDGVNLRDADLRTWTRQVAMVSQDPFLFHGSVAENLSIVRTDATPAQMESALRMAGAWEFVHAMPNKMQTLVGDRGLKLSGGQRQRLALARALICEPAVLLLDEATSALDSETEHAVQEALEKLRGRITMVIVAHRLATIRQCDRIVVLEAGKFVESGTHEELLQRASLYARYWEKQSGGREKQSNQV
jgi:subfamily B ATP-binding cassette protein MsbA